MVGAGPSPAFGAKQVFGLSRASFAAKIPVTKSHKMWGPKIGVVKIHDWIVDMKSTFTPPPSTPSTPTSEPPKTIPFPTPARPPGRPKILTDALIDEICTAIRIDGMSDTGAGDLAG